MSGYDQNLFRGIVLYTYAENIKFLPFTNSSINSEQHKKNPKKPKNKSQGSPTLYALRATSLNKSFIEGLNFLDMYARYYAIRLFTLLDSEN